MPNTKNLRACIRKIMSDFEVPILKVDEVLDHPNADRLSLIKIRDYITISAKLEDGSHRYKKDDLVIYVPENSIVPENLLKEGFWNEDKNKGMLSGKNGDVVKPVRLRGTLSEGILFPLEKLMGLDVSSILNISKYEPPIPANFAGDVVNIGSSKTVHYDIENIKKYPDLFTENDDVVVTEKGHGTFCCFGYHPDIYDDDLYLGDRFVYSKGLGKQGLIFKYNTKNIESNIYCKIIYGKYQDVLQRISRFYDRRVPIYIMGEIMGPGVQDLSYGLEDKDIYCFDVYVGNPGEGGYLPAHKRDEFFTQHELKKVPELYRGRFDIKKILELTNGKTKFSDVDQIREGVVISSAYGERKILKSVSEDYLFRKGSTTEYQ